MAWLPLAQAHEGEEETAELEGYEVTVTPQEAVQGDELPIEARILKGETPLAGSAVTFTVDRHEDGISDRLETEEREPGRYVAKYRFTKSGEHEIHVEFTDAGETKRVTAAVNALRASVWTPGRSFGIGAAALALLALIAGFLRKKPKAAITGAFAALIAGGIAYSLYVTFRSGAASRGVVTCVAENECYLTAHIHAYAPIEICGEEFRLPIEKGALTGPHTHEEKNIIHWHDRLRYDKGKQDVVDPTPFTLGAFFDAVEIPFTSDAIANQANGGACNGEAAALKVFVNGKQNAAYRSYRWSDKDVIFIVFDSRTPAEVEAWLKTNPIVFPTLGRG